jgi:4-hydroxybenzoyl-CoA reductase subunit beta
VRLPKFNYLEPGSIEEASTMLTDEAGAKILAGGTDLLVNMKHRVEIPVTLVNLKKIKGLDAIQLDNGNLRIGALTPLKKIARDPSLVEKIPVLARAASSVGSYHHQTMGTIGGNICQQNRCQYYNQSQWWRSTRETCLKAGGEICHVVGKKGACYSSYCGDMAPALLVLEARVILKSQTESREIPIEDLFSGDGKIPLVMKTGEILSEIVIPGAAKNGLSTYVKFANRESIDFPIVGMAFQTFPEKKEYRVAFTAVDRRPLRGRQVESLLHGKDLTHDLVEQASAISAKEAKPVKNSLYSPAYKRRLMGILLQSVMSKRIRGLNE